MIESVNNEIIKYVRGNLLDIGCGDKPFFLSIKDMIEKYIGLDHPGTLHSKKNIDIFAIADDLPFKNNAFDSVLLTQVIEHLENPLTVLSEIYRVLKSDGTVIISWPFVYPIHEAPRDFYRYTEYGMRYLAQRSGFQIVKIKPLSGFWITYFSFLSIYISRKSGTLYVLCYPFLLLFKYICIICEKIDTKSKTSWTWNYLCILKKE